VRANSFVLKPNQLYSALQPLHNEVVGPIGPAEEVLGIGQLYGKKESVSEVRSAAVLVM
jgi:hypothetical protein